jgi:Bacterial aa3 type cytochrome c oxidase subunit IV
MCGAHCTGFAAVNQVWWIRADGISDRPCAKTTALRLCPRFAKALAIQIPVGGTFMADHSPAHKPRGFQDHKETYDGFLKGSVALSIVCLFVLVALVAFRFMPSLNVFTGFAGIIAGIIAVLIDLRTGAKWYLSGGLLVLFGLFVAANV